MAAEHVGQSRIKIKTSLASLRASAVRSQVSVFSVSLCLRGRFYAFAFSLPQIRTLKNLFLNQFTHESADTENLLVQTQWLRSMSANHEPNQNQFLLFSASPRLRGEKSGFCFLCVSWQVL